ncbi:hypothetical protein BGZ97_000395 [Linnemannia gamsii]|uniref:Uncharacterized protein n=1 Tax=Linnemannia gamsii TaxID=64522 RepID=A0A9P6UUT7_9FUNG|nr:hypothetical protein BGZ97_000395 [Linnemannia gamsii]
MRQEFPDPSSPFSEASDLDDLVSYFESEDPHDYPSDSDLPSYTTDIDHDDHDDNDLALSSSSSPRHNDSTATIRTPISLALAQEDMPTPDSDSTQQRQQQEQQVQSAQRASDIVGNNNNTQPVQDNMDNRSDGDEHDFLLIDPKDAIADASSVARPPDATDPQQQQGQCGPQAVSETVEDNAATSLDTAPDNTACQESRSTDLLVLPAGQQAITRAVLLHAEVPSSEEAITPLSSPSSASSDVSASQVAATTTHVYQPHTETTLLEHATLECPESAGGHRSLRIKIAGRDLTDNVSTRIQEKITTNFILQHKHQHMSGIPRPDFETESAESAALQVAQNVSTDLCVYVLPASGPTRYDAEILLQFAQALLPLLVLVSADDYLDPFTAIDLRQQLATHLRQPGSRQASPIFKQQVHVILQSCFTMQDLLSIHIQRLIDRSTPVQASMFDPICEKWRAFKEFMDQGQHVAFIWRAKLQDSLTTGVGVFFVALTIILAVLVGTHMSSSTFSQPSHVIVRQIDYVQNGRMGVAHVDFLTAKGTPYKGRHQHPFHVRILGDDKAWTVRGAPSESAPGVGDPIVQNLGNGTFKIYITLLRKRHLRAGPADTPLSSWLCPTKTQHFIHIWFANGTRVPLTPRELVWPKRVVVPSANRVKSEEGPIGDSKSSSCPGVRSVHRGNCKCRGGSRNTKAVPTPAFDKINDFEDDEDEDASQVWKDQLQRLSAPMAKHLSNDTLKWMSRQWGLLQPVLCDVHDITNNALSYALHSAKRLFFLFSSWVDQVFGRQDYLVLCSKDILSRAHQGAHQLKDRFFQRCSKDMKHNTGRKEQQRDLIVLLDEQFQSLKRTGQAAAEAAKLPTAEKVLQKMDDLMVEVEDQVEKFLKSKRVKAMTERVNAEEILKKADKVLADAEDRMEKVWKTKMVQDVHQRATKKVDEVLQTQFAQDINNRVAKVMKSKMVKDAGDRIQRKAEHLAATPAGKKWIHRMEVHHWLRQGREKKKDERPLGWFRKRCQRAFRP